MTNIKKMIEKIRSAIYGEEVRNAIINSFAFIDAKINWVIILLALQGLVIILSNNFFSITIKTGKDPF